MPGGANVARQAVWTVHPVILQPGPLDTAHFEVWHWFNWRTVIALRLTSQLNPHHSPYCTESTQDSKEFKTIAASVSGQGCEIRNIKLSRSTHDIVVCKHIFPMLQCVQHHLFSWRLVTVSRKADQRGGTKSHTKHYCFGFQVISSQSECKHQKTTVPGRSVQQTLFCPVCKRLSLFIRSNTVKLWQPSFCSQSLVVILTSLLTAHTAETPFKRRGMYGKYGVLEFYWQSRSANKGTRGQSQAFTQLQTSRTAFSITHRLPVLAFSHRLRAVRESKCSIASNDTGLSHRCEWEPCPPDTLRLGRNQAISGSGCQCAPGVDRYSNFHRWLKIACPLCLT